MISSLFVFALSSSSPWTTGSTYCEMRCLFLRPSLRPILAKKPLRSFRDLGGGLGAPSLTRDDMVEGRRGPERRDYESRGSAGSASSRDKSRAALLRGAPCGGHRWHSAGCIWLQFTPHRANEIKLFPLVSGARCIRIPVQMWRRPVVAEIDWTARRCGRAKPVTQRGASRAPGRHSL